LEQGDVGLIEDAVAQELLQSTAPAHLAYNWTDGTPRVVPIWFHWTGEEIVMGTPPAAPKLKALANDAPVAITIDSAEWPYKVLYVRGTAEVTMVQGVVPEYAEAAKRYFGETEGRAWVDQMPADVQMGRVAVRPEWVAVLDFTTRFPSAISG
jgi:PPOX class probable F420-dependent enzyme